jgi:hypothetical protein
MVNLVKQYFATSIAVTVIGLVLAFFIGGLPAVFIAAVLGVLEVSLSFDNAVVNAKVLKDMSDLWRHRFLTWGMLIAVFGMRVLFPLVIVGIALGVSPLSALLLAVEEPEQYAHALESVHTSVMGFGGAFLGLVALKFFIDETKELHWLEAIEHKLTILGKIEAIQVVIVLLLSYGMYHVIGKLHGTEEAVSFLISSMFGIILYILVDGIEAFIGVDDGDATKVVAQSGLASFLYLEILDSSFSFDGVLGALALTNNIFIIAIGLGIGAMFVRSMTILLVDKGTLAEYKFLEHSAFYAIGILATIMFINTVYEIPEVITGLIGVVVIGLGVFTSSRSK